MQKDYQVAAFEGGALRVIKAGNPGHEAVLALPLNRLIAKIIRVAPGEDVSAVATQALQAMSPFPDEPLTVGIETISESEAGTVVLAAALPESAADDIGEALDAAKLNVTRIDILALGQLRDAWSRFDAEDGKRRIVRIKSPDCISIFVLDGGTPVALRGLADETDLPREEMLMLLEAESFGGAKPLAETIEVESSDAALEGVEERSETEGTLNALPASWAEVLDETRFKAKLVKCLAVAVGVWLLVIGVLFGVPFAYGRMTAHQKALVKRHEKAFKEVSQKQELVKLFQKFSDRSRGALEIMKAVSDRLPGGITLTSWTFDRENGLTISGETETEAEIYKFKDTMETLTFGEGVDERVFASVSLGESGLRSSKGKWRFDLTLGFKAEEEMPE